jgi:Tfp pilus assembly protein PilN
VINLLHPEIKENRKINLRFTQLTLFFSIILLLALSTWVSLLYAKNALLTKNESLDNQISTVDTKVLKYRDLEKMIGQTNKRLDQLAVLQNNQQPWSEKLTALVNNTPSNIQIINLTVGLATDSGLSGSNYQFTISANAKSLEDIETYRKTLDSSSSFTGTSFKSANFSPETGGFTFNLTTLLKGSK